MQLSGRPAGTGTSPEQWARVRRLSGPPDNEVATVVALNAVLARSADLAVVLSSADVFRSGLQLDLTMRTRTASSGHAPGPTGPAGPWTGSHRPDSPDRWLLGVEFADGRTATTLGVRRGPGALSSSLDESRPRLLPRGGGGGGRAYDSRLWLAPVPPPGPLTVVFAWPALDIDETVTVLEGAWQQVAASVQPLWDEQPEAPPTAPDPVPPVRLQPGGWFEQHPDPAA